MIGVDIIEIHRIRKALEDPAFAKRIFTDKERAYCDELADPSPRYAGRFAAKEAIAKALGTGFGAELAFQHIEILNQPSGAPTVVIKHRQEHILLSISHCKSHAIAFALVQKTG